MEEKIIDYYQLAKGYTGTTLIALLKKVLNDSDIFTFGEFLDIPAIKNFCNSSNQEENRIYQLLELFAFGNWIEYTNHKGFYFYIFFIFIKSIFFFFHWNNNIKVKYGEITIPQQKKLKQLTIVSLASINKLIPYQLLMQQLQMNSVRELEDLVLDTFYQELVGGKLDQINSLIHIDKIKARDIRPTDLIGMNEKLKCWINKSEILEKKISESINYSQKKMKEYLSEKILFEEEMKKKIEEVTKLLQEKGGEHDQLNHGRRNRKRNPNDFGGRSFLKRFRN